MHSNLAKLPNDGYLVVPLSMARLEGDQSPEACYELLQYFETMAPNGIDVVFLYANSCEPSRKLRQVVMMQMLEHKAQLQSLIIKRRKYMPQAFHYLPWDYVLLNGVQFDKQLTRLRRAYEADEKLQQAVLMDVMSAGNEASTDFILERVVAMHIIRQKLIELPKTLVRGDTFRLIIAPEPYSRTDVYQFEHKILDTNPFLGRRDYPTACGHYDYANKIFYDYRELMREAGAHNIVEMRHSVQG